MTDRRILEVTPIGTKLVKKTLEDILEKTVTKHRKNNEAIAPKTIATIRGLLSNDASFLRDIANEVSFALAQKKQDKNEPSKVKIERAMRAILRTADEFVKQLKGLDSMMLEHYTSLDDHPHTLAQDVTTFQSHTVLALNDLKKQDIRRRVKAWQYDLAGNIARVLVKHHIKPTTTRYGIWYLLTEMLTKPTDTQNILRTVRRTPAFKALLKKA